MIFMSFNDVRHIHLTDKYSANVGIANPSAVTKAIRWLLMHRVGQQDDLVEDGNVLANVHVEDSGAFTMPWRFRQYEAAVRKVPAALAHHQYRCRERRAISCRPIFLNRTAEAAMTACSAIE
jgi:hypothetical protein